ncbi:MAG: DegV family protein [Chloroflexi bacterium]|nr:DegV family protein [Chloroflexota bacterium]
MLNLHIVTDSFAQFAEESPPPNVTVLPNLLTINGRTYREGIDISVEEAFRLRSQGAQKASVTPPTSADLSAAYERLGRDYDAIVSIHGSREMFDSWQNAQIAAQSFPGATGWRWSISQTLSAAQGMLVKLAAREAAQQNSLDDIVRILRGAIEQLYMVFFVETIDTLLHHRILPPSQTVLGAMLNIKPILSVENGKLIAIEKVRTRAQAVERLAEFVVEFTDIADAVIIQHRTNQTEQTRMLQERLQTEFPLVKFPYTMYGASLAALIGLDATGLAVLENPGTRIDDGF